MNSRIKGNIGIGQSIAYFTSLGYSVSIPLTDTQPYDLIVDDGKFLFRVQVKYVESSYVGLRTIRCNTKETKVSLFDRKKIDILIVVRKDDGIYLIPTDELKVKTGLKIGKKYQKWKVSHLGVGHRLESG